MNADMNYEFPIIQHIDHVLPFIDDDCFKVVEKECGHTYINYVKMGPDTFPAFLPWAPQTLEQNHDHWETERDEHNHRTAIRRECRGLAFLTRTGQLVSRPFHKFFNVGENEEMDIANLNFRDEHWVQDKVDGSMVRPIWTPRGIRWGTKMGITDTAAVAEAWLVDKPHYVEMVNYYIEHGYTPIFEFTSPETRIVVDYGDPTMTLLAIRDTDKGTYLSPAAVASAAVRYGVPSVKMYDPIEGDPAAYIELIRASEDLDEGIVVVWGNGQRAKTKTETYSILHRVKESARTERTFVTALLAEEIDDLMPMLPEEDRDRLTRYIKRFWSCVNMLEDDISELYGSAREDFETKKDFAIGTSDHLTTLERKIIFSLWDEKIDDAQKAAMQIVQRGLTSETKWAEMRENVALCENFHTFDTGWMREDDDD